MLKESDNKHKMEIEENWALLKEHITQNWKVDLNEYSREDRYLMKDLEEELDRIKNMECIFPNANFSE